MSAAEKDATRPTGFAVVMESDLDLRAVLRDALVLDGHRVECARDCAAVLAWRGPPPDELVLALGGAHPDPEWETLRGALDRDAVFSRAAVIVLLTIRNGLTFPSRARIVQKPFAMEKLLALIASDMATPRRTPLEPSADHDSTPR